VGFGAKGDNIRHNTAKGLGNNVNSPVKFGAIAKGNNKAKAIAKGGQYS